MKICFPTLLPHSQLLIWDYDQESNYAVCVLKNEPDLNSRQVFLEKLKKIPGITVAGRKLCIENIREFATTYSMEIVDNNENDKRSNYLKLTSRGLFQRPISEEIYNNNNKTINWHRKRALTPIISTTITTTTTAASDGQSLGITLDNLINASTPEVWGNTLSYLDYFSKKTKEDERKRPSADFISGIIDIQKKYQYLKNEKLYPIKERQMKAIKIIFDELLAPLYVELASADSSSQKLRVYLREAVEGCMLNERLNFGPTYSEMLTKEEKERKYKSEDEYNYAVEEERIARVNVMLRPLIFFVTPALKASALTKDPQVAEELTTLREKITPALRTKLLEKIEDLRASTIEAGQVQYDYSQQQEVPLEASIAAKTECIRDEYYSCYRIIHNAIKQKFQKTEKEQRSLSFIRKSEKEQEQKINQLAENIIAGIIPSIREQSQSQLGKGHIGRILPGNLDFYFSQKGAELLSAELAIYLKDNREELVSSTIDFLKSFLAEKLQLIFEKGSLHSDESEVLLTMEQFLRITG
jgi:hypothetical protein